MTAAWVVRAGRSGERDQWALENGFTGGGWKESRDLTDMGTREQIAESVAIDYPDANTAKAINYTGQLWALRGRIEVGDLMVLPLKTTSKIAFGRVTSEYLYRADDPSPDRRHVRRVDWIRTDLPRAAVKQDLLFTLGSALSVFQPSKNDALNRLEHLAKFGVDPGQGAASALTSTSGSQSSATGASDDIVVDQPELNADIEEIALDRITSRIAEDFAGHDLARLVASVLEADGYECVVSPPGPDGGIDIRAGRGPLGLDSPLVFVQVKSGDGQVGAPVVSQLHGVMSAKGADQGLLVAWGGLSKPARDAMNAHQLRVKVWESRDVVSAVLRTYDRLPDVVRAELPLKRVWLLAEDSAQSV